MCIRDRYAFPSGVEIRRLRTSNSFSELNRIVFANNFNEQAENFFVFLINSELTNLRDAGIRDEVLLATNPSLNYYCVCVRTRDYFDLTPEEDRQKGHKARRVYSHQTVHCFMTYFPFIRLFLDIIVTFLNTVKIARIEQFSATADGSEVYSKIDASYIQKVLVEELGKHLGSIYRTVRPAFGDTLEIDVGNDHLSISVLEKVRAYMTDALWACPLAFSNLPLEDLYWLWATLLLENHVVLVTENLALLTATVYTFPYLL
eukprot:TRINITY_DN9966_c0_g1_i5.p1 TRINITY_DN9966_c0_g1~~TRINITY_DN9966_c0_g1_i5.p1  ORF type:complete len:260 (+),score=41.30 TRINITY_DN9966_c0_g1_i5:65-844(+)